MKITLLWIGKTRNASIRNLIQDYRNRIGHFCELSIIEVKPIEDDDIDKLIFREGERLLIGVVPSDFLILLDVEGKSLTSARFADFIALHRDRSQKNLVFAIGGHAGLSKELKGRANLRLSVSQMTLTHEMTRLVLMEQIYRAFTLIHHIPYHK